MQYDRRRLILTSSMVAQPTHFRYAWGRNPLANLQATGNKDLPFGTQRSDDWRMEEVPLDVVGDESGQPMALPISRRDRNEILQALRQQDQQCRLTGPGKSLRRSWAATQNERWAASNSEVDWAGIPWLTGANPSDVSYASTCG